MDVTLCDRYRILNPLASWGFGETFLAIDLHSPTQRKVVVKALKSVSESTNSEIIEKLFLKEAQVLEELGNQHPQIPTLYAYFCQDNQYYLVQEYIEGKNLTQMGILSPQRCLSILLSLLETLKYVHNKNIIHRDIKPENIIIRESDGLPVLIDFGAVKETMGILHTSLGSEVSSVIVGTTSFMAPEQSAGRTVFSTDLFALGLTIIYTLTGKYPLDFPSNNITGEIEWQNVAPNLAPTLARVLNKATKMDLSGRYLTAKAMLQDLKTEEKIAPTTLSLHGETKTLPPTQIITPSSLTVSTNSWSAGQNFAHDSQRKQNKSSSNTIIILLGLLVALSASLLGFLVVQSLNQGEEQLANLKQINTQSRENNVAKEQEQVGSVQENSEQIFSAIDNINSSITVEEGINVIEDLYYFLSEKDFNSAQNLYSPNLAQQFTSRFFNEFNRVTVENLQVTSQTSTSISFLGYNTYIYHDGSTQREQRSYSVMKIDGIPQIVSSDFIRVTKFR